MLFLFAVVAPVAKRLKHAVVDGAKPVSCKAPSEEIKSKEPFGQCKYVPVYYHWFAVILQEYIENQADDDCILQQYISKINKDQLATVVEKVMAIKEHQPTVNEYACSSLMQDALSGFFFDSEERKNAACLGQYPVYGTRRTDWSVYTLHDFLPFWAILHSDYKPSNFLNATKETICYFISANQEKTTFSWCFGLPCTSKEMAFQLYMSANRQVLVIEVARVDIANTDAFKRFLSLVYAAVHWRINNLEIASNGPLACEPIKGVVLRDNFANFESDRVFYVQSEKKVYKIYKDQDAKKPNYLLMQKLGYFEDLELKKISKTHWLLSYKVLQGKIEPWTWKQIEAAKNCIKRIHEFNVVHADVRIGNIVFSGIDKAFLIDFDFAGPPDTEYHENYNVKVEERHSGAKPGSKKAYSHDLYSLQYIAQSYFNNHTFDV